MKTLDEIKQMMAAGDTAQANEALKELLAAEPNNLQAKMLYGTCRQLLGDEETFKRIHDELAPAMERLAGGATSDATPVQSETLSLWKKYQILWEYLILGTLVLSVAVVAIVYFGKTATLYGGPAQIHTVKEAESRQEKVEGSTDVPREKFSDCSKKFTPASENE